MKQNQLLLQEIPDESTFQKRMRWANALIKLLEDNDILRREVAAQLNLCETQLDYRKATEPAEQEALLTCYCE